MNLVIDIGNSRTKVAIFDQNKMVKSFLFDDLTTVGLKEILQEFQGTKRAILSSVASVDPFLYDDLKAAFSFFLEVNNQTPMPMKIKYRTPETLGLDRLAAAIGAREIFPDRDLLVIDAGTAITFDLIEREGTFLGGNISPGLKTRFRALHEFTQNCLLQKRQIS